MLTTGRPEPTRTHSKQEILKIKYQSVGKTLLERVKY